MAEATILEIGPHQLGPLAFDFAIEKLPEMIKGQLRTEAWAIMTYIACEAIALAYGSGDRFLTFWELYVRSLHGRIYGTSGLVSESEWRKFVDTMHMLYAKEMKDNPQVHAFRRVTNRKVFDSQGIDLWQYLRVPKGDIEARMQSDLEMVEWIKSVRKKFVACLV